MPPTDHEQRIDNDLKQTIGWLGSAAGVGGVAVLIRFICMAFGAHANHLSATFLLGQMCVGLIWALAWLAAGFLLGFLFGVPKSVSQTASGPTGAAPLVANINAAPPVPGIQVENEPPRPPRLKVNTNLEDISDWLTKILVGATLTQIGKIPHIVWGIALHMSLADSTPAATGFDAAILLYYSALGFLSGYIITRMFFARAFELAG